MDRLSEIQARMLEIRSLLQGEEEVDLNELETELRELSSERDQLETRARLIQETNEIDQIEKRSATAGRVLGNYDPIDNSNETRSADPTDTIEYRQAFMDHVLNDQPMDGLQLRANQATQTTDIGAVIPKTILNRIIEKINTYGQIYKRIKKTNVKGGVSIPISDLKPTASWVGEGTVADKQKKTATGSVTFSYHKLQVRIAVTLEADTVSLDIFETTIVDNAYEAMIMAAEDAVFNGTGNKQPLGILVDPRVTEEVEVKEADISKYKTWAAIIAKIPLAGESKVIVTMTKKDWDTHIVGMVDAQGQPVGRVTYGLEGKPQRRLLGYEVELVESYLPTFAAAEEGNVFGVICDYNEYLWNSNLQMTYKKYFDDNTDEYIHKNTMIADGKVADPQNFIKLVKAASA